MWRCGIYWISSGSCPVLVILNTTIKITSEVLKRHDYFNGVLVGCDTIKSSGKFRPSEGPFSPTIPSCDDKQYSYFGPSTSSLPSLLTLAEHYLICPSCGSPATFLATGSYDLTYCSWTLVKEAGCPSETTISTYKATQCHRAEDYNVKRQWNLEFKRKIKRRFWGYHRGAYEEF
jgi:hypothetical protein